MAAELVYTTFDTGIGRAGILASAQGLLAATLPRPTEEEVLLQLDAVTRQAIRSDQRLADAVERLRLYYRGSRVIFEDELDLSEATPFQREAWTMLRSIPYGETRSYLWVAGQMGRPRAARAVGQAVGRNPLAIIIPCHRVVASGGGLGGFGGGLEMKRWLLRLEGSDY